MLTLIHRIFLEQKLNAPDCMHLEKNQKTEKGVEIVSGWSRVNCIKLVLCSVSELKRTSRIYRSLLMPYILTLVRLMLHTASLCADWGSEAK